MMEFIYLLINSDSNDFKKGINWLHKQVIQTNASIIFLTPPVYDEIKGEAYATVLDIYADWLLSKKYTDGWKIIDIHWPMKKYLEDQRLIDSTFYLAKDGIHPNEEGHWQIAKQVLLSLGENEVKAVSNFQEILEKTAHGEEIFKLVDQYQQLMKDAWLTHIGHERPNMNEGIPLDKAKVEAEKIVERIRELQ